MLVWNLNPRFCVDYIHLPRNGIIKSSGNSLLRIFETLPAWAILHSHLQGRMVPIPLHSLQHLLHCLLMILAILGEGNGNPLQCSCLENPREGGAWWDAFCGVHRVGNNWSDLAAAAVSVKLYLTVVLTCISLMISESHSVVSEYLSEYLRPHRQFSRPEYWNG